MGEYFGGDEVLVRGVVSADGRCVRLMPGVEILLSPALQIATEIPKLGGNPAFLLLCFHSPEEREEYAAAFHRLPDAVEAREV